MTHTKQVTSRIRHTMANQAPSTSAPTANKAPAKPNGEAVKAAARGRIKKVDAAYSISFLNEKGEESNRIPTVVPSVRVKGADGKTKTINLKDIPPNVLQQLAADGIRKKINFFLKDVTKQNVGQVQVLVDEFIKVTKDATLYIPKEGGGPGRTFDYDFWLDVLARTAEIKVKAGNPKAKLMTEKTRQEARTKLEAMTPDERKEKQKAWEQDKVFKNAAMQIRAERATAKMSKDDAVDTEHDALAGLF